MLREHERTQSKLKEDLGELVLSALSDDEIFEIMLNPDGTLWVEGFARNERIRQNGGGISAKFNKYSFKRGRENYR